MNSIVALSLLLFAVACADPEPKEIDYGRQLCTNCEMTVEDKQFGAEAVSHTGKVYVFDAIECMLGWYLEEADLVKSDVHSLWVTDYTQPGVLIDAKTAFFVKSDDVRSPMSLNVAAFPSAVKQQRFSESVQSPTSPSFDELLALAEDYR